MTIELAQQLSKAGFPQNTEHFWQFIIDRWEINTPLDYLGKEPKDAGWETYAAPTLSELIAACWNAFTELSLVGPSHWWARAKWKARASAGHWPLAEADGKTPEEAVAMLWLALNASPKDSLT
jgi:hypothetical protein